MRGILYIALMQDEGRKVQVDEIAEKLSIPRHFLGKILQLLVRNGFLQSTKGPYGGFSLAQDTLKTPLIRLVTVTGDTDQFSLCVLQMRTCEGIHPCPLHSEMERMKQTLLEQLRKTTISDLLQPDKMNFIKSLSVV